MAAKPIDIYRRQIERELQAGNSTEHTHRPALKDLIESLEAGVTATNEPKRVECGAPDFIVSRKSVHGPMTLGYIEAKDVEKDLGEIEHSDQIKRYRSALPNLVLTDYLEFRWYVLGEHRQTTRLARVGKGGKLVPESDGAESVSELLAAFLAHQAPSINTPKELALRMARLTHLIRDIIQAAFEKEQASATVRDLHKAFEKVLIPDLPVPQFADMFSQTLAYGLFAARMNHRGPRGSFKRLGAAAEIPKTNPFLRQLFETITGTALDDEPFVGFVDDLAQLLADTDIDAVLADFGKRTARQDPVVHFYETFLAAYDPKLRESRGVYYTPEPVVSYIVRSVDALLKNRFGCAGGLADTATVEYEREQQVKGKTGKVKVTSPRVLILDPSCGTGTFLYSVVDHIRAEFVKQGNAGMWSGYVRNHLLPRLFGFELLMAPYAVAHFKLGMQLAGYDLDSAQRPKWAYDFSGDERLGVFLTNTLEEAEIRAETLFGPLRVISQEANAAAKIKRELPILAVIGNPPYSGHSANRSWEIKEGKKVATFIGQLIQDYYFVDGQPLGEKNPKWLQDDYVKFIRWGQWRIEQTGAGILAFITNHGYLDNPTFRGMRQQLMNAFTEIYVLDLHGNSKKKERAPDGSKDENVFDIQQGVTLGIFVKEPNKAAPAKVFCANLWGPRETKYQRLFETELTTTAWKELDPQSPFYMFIARDMNLAAEHERAWKITDVMPLNVLGFQTHRDHFAVDFDAAALRARIEDLRLEAKSDEELRSLYELSDNRDWQLSVARNQVRDDKEWEQRFIECLYRPFDWRPCYFSTVAMDYPRRELLDHVARKDNLCLNTMRQTKMASWQHAVVSDSPAPAVYVELKDGSNLFPLYLYPKGDQTNEGQGELRIQAGHWPAGKDGRRPNLNPKFVADLEKRLRLKFVPDGKGDVAPGFSPASKKNADLKVGATTFGPEDVFNYIYAVFHSPTFRTRYAEFLKSDFPRVPLTSNLELFRSLCALGGELVALHLLESPKLEKPIARFPIKGPNLVEKGFPKYVAPGEPEPFFVEAALRRQKDGEVNSPLQTANSRLKEGRVYINKAPVAPVSSPASSVKSPVFSPVSSTPSPVGTPALQGGQYFEGVPPEVWNFHIGGYQVCEKWLKDRRGRTLTYDDLEHYCKVVTAINETIRLMAAIDAAIPKWPIE